jgi:predicted ribosome quality control (RQC) complex YloA/Tae2 family protein
MKTGMSSFDIAAMVAELQSLVGGRIDKSYQIDRNELLIRIRIPEKGRSDLVIANGKWIYLTSRSKQTPKTPTSFAMLLRKHLNNGTITKIEQYGFDRIVLIHIQKAESFQLIAELFGEGNVVLITEGKIIQPLIPKSWKQREVRAHREYEFPPSRKDLRTIDYYTFLEILSESKKDLVRTLALDINLGGIYSEEVCLLSGLSKNVKPSDLSNENKELIYNNIQTLLSQLKKTKGGIMVSENSSPIDIMPFPLKIQKDLNYEKFATLSESIDKYLESQAAKEPMDPEFESLKAKIQRQKDQQLKAIINLEKKAQEAKERAELIYANYNECNEILMALRSGHEKKNLDEVIAQLKENPQFSGIDLAKDEVRIICVDEEQNENELHFNFRKSLEENAGSYYDKAKKAKEKLEGAKDSLLQTEEKLSKIEVDREVKEKRKKRESKRFWFDRYRWFISSDGNIVVAGRDAKTNDKVVKKYLSDKDRYAHAEIHGAPSVVVKNKDGEIPERTLREACEFALAHSKAWNAKHGSGTAYWVNPDQVSKTPPAGEFIPRGAFVIRGRRNFIQNIELKMAIGSVNYEGAEKLMCAPESALESQSQSYIVFGPGDVKKSDFVKRICKVFDVEQEEVAGILPPGNIRILRTVGVTEE